MTTPRRPCYTALVSVKLGDHLSVFACSSSSSLLGGECAPQCSPWPPLLLWSCCYAHVDVTDDAFTLHLEHAEHAYALRKWLWCTPSSTTAPLVEL